MRDPRVERMAKVLVEYSLGVKEGDLVRIQGGPEGAPLLLALYEEVLARGGHPWVQLGLEGADEVFYAKASDAQLDFVPKFALAIIEEIQASISVWTETNTKRLTGVDPAKQARRARATRPSPSGSSSGRRRRSSAGRGPSTPPPPLPRTRRCPSGTSRTSCSEPAGSRSPTPWRRGGSSPGGRRGSSAGCPPGTRSTSSGPGPTSGSGPGAGRGSTATVTRTFPMGRSSPARSRRALRATSASPTRPASTAGRWRTSGWSSSGAGWWRPPPGRTRSSSGGCLTPTRAPATWGVRVRDERGDPEVHEEHPL